MKKFTIRIETVEETNGIEIHENRTAKEFLADAGKSIKNKAKEAWDFVKENPDKATLYFGTATAVIAKVTKMAKKKVEFDHTYLRTWDPSERCYLHHRKLSVREENEFRTLRSSGYSVQQALDALGVRVQRKGRV